MENVYCGIDVGRAFVDCASKRFTGNDAPHIPAKIGPGRTLNLGEKGEWVVEFDGRTYFVGDMARESEFEHRMTTETKIHEATRILFYTTLCLLEPEPDDKNLVVTTLLPVEQHTDAEKNRLRELLCGEAKVKVNGRGGRYHVEHLDIVPEGGAAQ